MNSPVLSIIIPVYNVEKYIKRCLDSVLSQTFEDYELFLIDDGSTDGSGEICKYFAAINSQKIHYIYKDNKGQGPARDLGVKLAKGKYITFLDADDWWAPEFCDQMINAISKSDADIVVCDINYVEENSRGQNITVSKIRLPEYKKIIPKEFPDSINRMRTFLWGKIFSRSLYNNSGLRQSGHKYQDFPVTAALVALSPLVCRVPRPMYFYYKSRKESTINCTSALGYMPDSIRDLVDNFKKLNLFDQYLIYLKKMAFSQVRFALKRMESLVSPRQEEILTSLRHYLFEVMEKYFPNWVNPYGLNICVCGSSILNKIVSTSLFTDADNSIDIEKKYTYVFIDLLDNNEADILSKVSGHNIENHVIIRLLVQGKENLLIKKYDELSEQLPCAITICPDEICSPDSLMEDSAVWNTADLIWYKLFSGRKGVF